MKHFSMYIIAVVLLLQGCEKDDFCNCFESTGGTDSEIRTLADFSTLDMNDNVDIILTPDSVNYVEVTCGKNLVDGITTEVVDGRLMIGNINRCNWLRDFKNQFTANIHFKNIRQINYNGSGDLSCTDTLRQEYIQVESRNGSGELKFLLNCNEVLLKLHTGPGDISAYGKAGVLYLYTAGNGYMKTAQLESQFVYMTTNSTGDCEVNPVNELDVEIGYNGDVFYKGNPPVIRKKGTGSGQLIHF